MEAGIVFDGQQVQEEETGPTCGGTNSAWIRRHLAGSIYLWACGEEADNEDDDPKLSDRLIGWLILLVQGFAYTMLIVLARSTSNSDTGSSAGDSGQSGYLLPSVTGAMYILVASTTHDLRAGFSLLVDGSCAGHRAFGTGLLIVYGIMIAAAMTVLVSTSDDSAAVVLNAVTVLFIADLDEKALKFLLTVPQKWRLFWAIQSIGISFALAIIAIVCMGDASPLLEGNNRVFRAFPTWYVWAVNPAGVTLLSLLLSSALQGGCDWWGQSFQSLDESTFAFIVSRVFAGLSAATNIAKERLRIEPCFCVALVLWLAQAAVSWFFQPEHHGFPIAFTLAAVSSASEDYTLVLNDNQMAFIYLNAVLPIGLAVKALDVLRRHKHVTAVSEPRYSSEETEPRGGWGSSEDSRVPALLVGWGVGYWVISLLFLFGCSWYGGGWDTAPVIVTVIGYVVVPCFLTVGMFMAADTSILGTRVGTFVKPAVDRMRNRRRVEYWIMATVFRDVLIIWVWYCSLLRTKLNYMS